MGYGDDLMATAYAKGIVERYKQDGSAVKVVFGDPDNFHNAATNSLKVHWSEIFENNPNCVHPDEPIKQLVCVPDYPGQRLYIDYSKCEVKDKQIQRFAWNPDFRATAGDFYFNDDLKSFASEQAMRLPPFFLVIEPLIARKPWNNHKGWPPERWQALVDATPEMPWVQLGNQSTIHGAQLVETPTYLHAAALLACAGGVVTTEGGMHHAAAALDIPAVVLWGHYTSPTILGYDSHTNLRHAEGIGCGAAWVECPECVESMKAISVKEVLNAVKEMTHADSYRASRQGPTQPVFRMVGAPTKGSEG